MRKYILGKVKGKDFETYSHTQTQIGVINWHFTEEEGEISHDLMRRPSICQ